MSRESITRRGRTFINAQMLDTGTIARPGATVAETTGVPTWTTVYTGPLSVETYEAQEANPEVAGAQATVQRYRVKIPVGTFAPEIGDRVTVTASTLDANLVGNKYRVVALLHKTAATAYRVGVEEVL